MPDKSFFERMVANRFVVCIKPQYPVAADAFSEMTKESTGMSLVPNRKYRYGRYSGYGRSLYFFGFQIDMGQSIQFVDNDIDIIRTDTGGNHGKP